MARYTGPKVKRFRREGFNIFEPNTSKFKAATKKNYPPGMHGKASFGKVSEYGKQLREKQKVKRFYGILERQFKKYYELASKSKGATGDEILSMCERRIDNVIYRAGFASSREHARQMAGHGIFLLNGRKITIPSILVSEGDKLEAKERARKYKYFENIEKSKYRPPNWVSVDPKAMAIQIKSLPQKDDLEKSINSQLIVEYYSK